MFADVRRHVPVPGSAPARPEQVARRRGQGDREDKVEVAVAPMRQRFLAHFGLASPGIAVKIASGGAGQKAAAEIAAGHSKDKR